MKTNEKGQWIVDLEKLTCRHTETELIVVFEKRGSMLQGKISMLPIKLVQEWANNPDCGDAFIRKAVIEADEVFFRAYFNREIAEKRSGTQLIA